MGDKEDRRREGEEKKEKGQEWGERGEEKRKEKERRKISKLKCSYIFQALVPCTKSCTEMNTLHFTEPSPLQLPSAASLTQVTSSLTHIKNKT